MEQPVCVVCGIGPKNGASFARRFHAEGYRVALLSRSTGFSTELAEELGEGAKAYACDVTKADSVAAAFGKVVDELGPVDTLVFNAGSGVWGNIEELSAEDFETSWKVNSLGLFHTSQAVIESMVDRGQGAIVVVGATASLRGKPFTTAFAPAKAAQRSLAQAMARHLAPKGIHVSLMILDGGVAAPKGDKIDTLHPDDIAQTAYFLANQPRSTWTFELDLRPHLENW